MADVFAGINIVIPVDKRDGVFLAFITFEIASDERFSKIKMGVALNITAKNKRSMLDMLIDQLTLGCNVAAACDAARTRTVVKAACAAVLGSAAVLIQ